MCTCEPDGDSGEKLGLVEEGGGVMVTGSVHVRAQPSTYSNWSMMH